MSTDPKIARQSNNQRCEALLRITEALSAWRDPEVLAKTLASELDKFLQFDWLDILVLSENSKEIEWHVWGKGLLPVDDLDLKELSAWDVLGTEELLHIDDWNSAPRSSHLKQVVAGDGINIGSVVRLPLRTPNRRLGTLGIASRNVANYRAEDISFLQLVASVVVLAIENGLRVQRAQARLQDQNDRLQLLLNLTTRITSNLELREVLRAIAANVREVIHANAVTILLPEPTSAKFRVFALDFPHGTGMLREELLVTPSAIIKKAMESLKPVLINTREREDLASEAYEIAAAESIRTACAIPLVNHGRALGILTIARTSEAPFTAEDVDFLSRASGPVAIAIENAVAYREISELKDKLAQEKLYLEEEIRSEMGFEQIIGKSTALRHVLELVNTVAPAGSTVLLLGETGTGKELIARAIHEHSGRKERSFVKLNCAAIPTGLVESELFGHEKGAFTGAIMQKVGRLELADQGTLFLDEVGDIPIEIQPKLLRALQEREFERLGSTHTRKVNVRLIAATNRNLEEMVAARQFRSDLYYRLNVFPIRIPPLRDRREDIPFLVTHFVHRFAKQMQKKIESVPAPLMKALTAWDWPGNIRELENFIERAVILTRGKSLEAPMSELRRSIQTPASPTPNESVANQDVASIVKETLESLKKLRSKSPQNDFEESQRQEIMRVLRETHGRVGGADGAAARMGINRTTLISRMKRFGIDPRQYA